MTLVTFGLDLLAAIGIGALVGLEREHRKEERDAGVIAGIRTFPLISASGFLVTVAGDRLGEPLIVAAGVLGAALLGITFFWVRYGMGIPGLTTPMAIVVTFLAGVLVGLQLQFEAIVVGVATTFLLVTKKRLHGIARNLDEDEVLSALQFVAVAFVLLPLSFTLEGSYLNGIVGRGRPVDPVWTIVIVVAVSAIGFVSFVALRQVGARVGLLTSGALGGLANSEAATASLATLAKQDDRVIPAAIAGTLAATTAMVGRNVVIAAIAEPGLTMARAFVLPVLPIALLGALFAWVWMRRSTDRAEVTVDNPFALKPAIKFALVFALVNAVAWWLSRTYGDVGVYVTAVGAVVSSGAVVASAASLALQGTITVHTAVVTAMLATLIGVANKIVIVAVTNRSMLRRTVGPILAMLLVGLVGLGAFFIW